MNSQSIAIQTKVVEQHFPVGAVNYSVWDVLTF